MTVVDRNGGLARMCAKKRAASFVFGFIVLAFALMLCGAIEVWAHDDDVHDNDPPYVHERDPECKLHLTDPHNHYMQHGIDGPSSIEKCQYFGGVGWKACCCKEGATHASQCIWKPSSCRPESTQPPPPEPKGGGGPPGGGSPTSDDAPESPTPFPSPSVTPEPTETPTPDGNDESDPPGDTDGDDPPEDDDPPGENTPDDRAPPGDGEPESPTPPPVSDPESPTEPDTPDDTPDQDPDPELVPGPQEEDSEPFWTECLIQHAATPVQLCPSLSDSGWWLFHIGRSGWVSTGGFVPTIPTLERHGLGRVDVNLLHEFNSDSGRFVTVMYHAGEGVIRVRTAYEYTLTDHHKPYVFVIDRHGSYRHEQW